MIAAAFYGAFISWKALPPYLTPHPLDTIIVTVFQFVFFGGVALLVYFSRYMQSRKWTDVAIIIGGLTYPLYLIHQTVGNTIIDYFKDYGTLYVRGGLVMVLMITLSYIAYRYDKRLRKYLSIKLLPAKQ